MTTATSSNTTATTSTRTTPPQPSSSSSSAGAGGAGSATQACAACKYQRRKCNPDCILAPYFPADQQRQFLNAHRLFGVRNILRIIGHLDPVQRGEAMRSIIFQSNARAHDPVGGCCRIILELERQIERDSAELALVLRQLAICRAQAQAAALSPATTDVSVNPNLILSTGDDAGGNAIYSGHENGLLLPPMQQQQQPQQQYYDYFYYDGGGGGGGDNPNNSDSNNNSISNSHSINDNHHHRYNNSGLEMEVPTSSMLSLHPQQRCKVDEETVKPLVDMFGVRQPITIGDEEEEEEEEEESANNFAATVTETFQCSSKIEFKEELNHKEEVPEHDLKGAASLFTLTNRTTSSI